MLVRYDHLLADLPGEMQRLADRLGIPIDPERVTTLAAAAGFDAMKKRSDETPPDPCGMLLDSTRFFRRARSAEAAGILTDGRLCLLPRASRGVGSTDLLDWLRPGSAG